MNNEEENLIANKLITIFHRDTNLVIENLLNKASLDVKNDLVNLLKTDDLNLIQEAKEWVENAASTLTSEFKDQINKIVKEYLK